jgi:tripartite-type tricarboxylate transporter receptor subunit TctC
MQHAIRVLGVSCLALSAGHAAGQAYPAKPIRILIGFAPGGGTDVMARALSARLTESFKQQIVIDNRPGANGHIAAKLAADAPPDGYTVLFMSVAQVMSKPVYKNLGYDIERDLMPITIVSNVPNVVVTHPSLPVRTVKEMIALAKSKPGEITYATSGIGSPEHFAGEMFNNMAGTKLLSVPYKGGGLIAIDLVAGHIMVSFSTMPAIIPHVRSGRVRAVAVTSDNRAPVLPDVPTVAESGLPGYSMSTWYGAMLPAKTPREILVRLNQEILKALTLPDVKERMASVGADILGNTPEEAAAMVRTDVEKFTKIARESNIRAD